jgi:integrase/recombinase XerD
VTGMRFCEAIALQLEDVDLKGGVLTIRNSKFGRSRLVSLHFSTCRVLKAYLQRRDRHWTGRTVSTYLFVGVSGRQLYGTEVRQAFYWLSREIGLRVRGQSHGPRLHDFRHRFAVNALLRWYRSGVDPQSRLPVLSAYLGHTQYSSTYWYLSSCPELMRAAMQRLERRWEKRP